MHQYVDACRNNVHGCYIVFEAPDQTIICLPGDGKASLQYAAHRSAAVNRHLATAAALW